MKHFDSSSALAALVVAGAGYVSATAPSCPSSAPLSCQNTTAIQNTCCTEVHGQVLQTQFWDANPATGPSDSWTIHGLWPDNCDGSYPQNCDSSRTNSDIACTLAGAGAKGQATLNYMNTYWKDQNGNDETFWEHEWSKHGTCYSTLEPKCFPNYSDNEDLVDFFTQTVNLFKTLPTYQWLADAGITPDESTKYSSSDVLAALQKPRGVSAIISCTKGSLSQVEYTFSVKGSVADGSFEPAEPSGSTSNCGSSFLYPPKNSGSSKSKRNIAASCSGGSSGGDNTTTDDGATATATDAPTTTAAAATTTDADATTTATDADGTGADATTTAADPAQTTDDSDWN